MSEPFVPPEPQDPAPHSAWSFRNGLTAGLAATILLAGIFACLESPRPRGGDSVPLAVVHSASGTMASDTHTDQELRELAVGTWRDFYHGRRTLTLQSDGTATMVVELSGIKARLFTPRLVLDIAWSIEDGKMHRRTLGGRPADKVEFVNQRAGVAVAEPILALDYNRMVLLDPRGSNRYDWRRVPVRSSRNR